MKLLRLICLGLACTVSVCAKPVPTPEMAMKFGMGQDSVVWEPQYMDGNDRGIIFEFVPKSQSIDAWNEMVAQQIAFTHTPVRQYVDSWKSMLRQADPKISLMEEPRKDGSILVSYTSLAAKEISIRRFIQAQDGVYMLAYHVRPASKDAARYKLWHEIVATASLVPNPEKQP